MNPSRITLSILLLALLCACKPESTESELTLKDAWVRAMPPGTKMTAAYGQFTNNSKIPIEITAISSDSYEHVSLHKTVTEAGVSKMEAVPKWQIEPGQTFTLKPGDTHLMLMKPLRQLQKGDQVILTLKMASGAKLEYSFIVEGR